MHLQCRYLDAHVGEEKKGSEISLDYRGCRSCDPATQAGQSVASVINQKVHLVCVNIPRGGMAEVQARERPHGLLNAACLLRDQPAARLQPHGPIL